MASISDAIWPPACPLQASTSSIDLVRWSSSTEGRRGRRAAGAAAGRQRSLNPPADVYSTAAYRDLYRPHLFVRFSRPRCWSLRQRTPLWCLDRGDQRSRRRIAPATLPPLPDYPPAAPPPQQLD